MQPFSKKVKHCNKRKAKEREKEKRLVLNQSKIVNQCKWTKQPTIIGDSTPG